MSRQAYESMLIALQIVDCWDDPQARQLVASTVTGAELACGLVSLARTLRMNLGRVTGSSSEQINDAIRARTLEILATED